MRLLPILYLLIALPLQTGQAANALSGHPSPYLAMHADDPVQWQPWGEAALARARAENRPLFISSGYFSCHWCHVMQQQSYRDPAIAALLNRNFVPVKIDRELHPALDRHLIEFVRSTRGQAGWPLNVFLTPEGHPFLGLTYARPESFRALLQRVATAWEERGSELSRIAREAAAAKIGDRPPFSAEKGGLSPIFPEIDADALRAGLIDTALAHGDDLEGGFGMQSRFPMEAQWLVLLRRLEERPEPALRSLLELTLDQMMNHGLRDHLGGGFFRYTVDPGWQVPHYEKMLYTQALLSRLYLRAGVQLQRRDYLEVARETLDFALDEMRERNGGFISSLSAVDSAGVEGGGYLWSEAQLRQALSPEELAFAGKRWRLAGTPPTEDGRLPMRGEMPAADERTGAALESRVRKKLLAARAPRRHPRDTKQLAAWNGLMLSALVDGARILGDQRYRGAAAELARYLGSELWDGGRLHRMRHGDGYAGEASLEDYAYVAVALHAWGVYGESTQMRELGERIAAIAWKRHFSAGGWHPAEQPPIPGIAPEPAIADGPLPSPSASLIRFSLETSGGEPAEPVLRALAISLPLAQREPFAYAGHADLLLPGRPPSAEGRK